MSLRSFHIIFIAVCSLLMIYILTWSIPRNYTGYSSFAFMGLLSLIIYNFGFAAYYNKSINNSEVHPLFSNYLPFIINSLIFLCPPIGLYFYFKKNNSKRKILFSILSGVTFYLILFFGWLSYGIEKESLIEYRKHLESYVE